MLTRARSALIPVVMLGLALGVAGCGSSDDKPEAKESSKPSASATTQAPAAYLEVPAGVTLTEPGTKLELGAEGVIAFERRQKEVGALAVTVKRIERTSFQASFPNWKVDDVTAARTPYFVRLTVKNVGDSDLGGLQLNNVLFADDGSTLEAPNYYTKAQLPVCFGEALPAAFTNGASAELCQVFYIAPALKLESVSFTPPAGLDAITWSGAFSKVTKPAKKKAGKKAPKKAS